MRKVISLISVLTLILVGCQTPAQENNQIFYEQTRQSISETSAVAKRASSIYEATSSSEIQNILETAYNEMNVIINGYTNNDVSANLEPLKTIILKYLDIIQETYSILKIQLAGMETVTSEVVNPIIEDQLVLVVNTANDLLTQLKSLPKDEQFTEEQINQIEESINQAVDKFNKMYPNSENITFQ